MNEAKKAVSSSLWKALGHTFFNRDSIKRNNNDIRCLTLLAHPDDEILIAGIIQRLSGNKIPNYFATFTNGNGNTELPRIPELEKSLRNLGHSGKVECFMKERELTYPACTPQNAEGRSVRTVSNSDIEVLAEKVKKGIKRIEEIVVAENINTILVPEYAGGHIVHDITQMSAVLATRRLSKDYLVNVLEFPQYFLSTERKNLEPSQIRLLIRKVEKGDAEAKMELEKRMEFVTFSLAKFSPGKTPDYDESNIGMQNGTIHLTFPEILRKLASYGIYKKGTQTESLTRLTSRTNSIGDLSIEQLRTANIDRNYRQPPKTGLLLYELVTHRPFAEFSTFKRLYERLLKN